MSFVYGKIHSLLLWIFSFRIRTMRKITKKWAPVFAVISAVLMVGCSAMEGLGRDIQKGGQAIERAAQRHS
jgi:entericidin B